MELSGRDYMPVFLLVHNWHMEEKTWKLAFSLDLRFKEELLEYFYQREKGICIKSSELSG